MHAAPRASLCVLAPAQPLRRELAPHLLGAIRCIWDHLEGHRLRSADTASFSRLGSHMLYLSKQCMPGIRQDVAEALARTNACTI